MWISFILNWVIVGMVCFGLYSMFTGWDFMGKEGKLESPGLEMFRYFTIDSNILAGICSLIMAVEQIPVLMGKAESLPVWVHTIKLMGASGVMLTFLVTITFLMPQFENPFVLLYNSNLFFHLLVPLFAALSFVVTEHTDSLTIPLTLFSIVPVFIYEIYYLVSVFRHLKDGKPDKAYDFYNFLNGDIRRTPVVFVVVLLVSYLLALLLWWGNRI